MTPDCKWPGATMVEAPAISDDPIIQGIHELAARQEYDVWQSWYKERSRRYDEIVADALEDRLGADLARLMLKPATLQKYSADWRRFCAWCQANIWEDYPHRPLPASAGSVAHFLLSREVAGASYGRQRQYAAAIGHVHQAAGFADPSNDLLVKAALRWARRNPGGKRKAARTSNNKQKETIHGE